MFIYLIVTLFFQVDTVYLEYDQTIKFKAIYSQTLADGFSLSVDIDVDKNGSIYVLDHDKNSLSKYSSNFELMNSINKELNYSFSTSVTVFDNFLLLIGSKKLVLDQNLRILHSFEFLQNEFIYAIKKNEKSFHLITKKNRYNHNFTTITLENDFNPILETKKEFMWQEKRNSYYANGMVVTKNKIIQTYSGEYLFDSTDKNNNRKIFLREFKRYKRQPKEDITFLVKGYGVIKSKLATKNMNKTLENTFLDDIEELMGIDRNYLFFQTANSDNKRLEIDQINLETGKFRHFFMNFENPIYTTIIRFGKLYVVTRNDEHCRILVYNIVN